MRSICLTVHADNLPIFFPMLQDGINIQADVGCNLEQFLCTVLGVPIETIEQRIQILFLDGKAVDDMKSAFVRDGSSLALSSAMPGLAGTSLRRGGHLASLRSGITYQSKEETIPPGKGRISIKFFNLLISGLGLPLLFKGIRVGGVDLAGMLEGLSGGLRASHTMVAVDGGQITVKRLLAAEMISEVEKETMWSFRVKSVEE